MYAIVDIKGKQMRVAQGDKVYVNRLAEEPGSAVSFDQVLMVADGDKVHIGTPTVKGSLVKATILDHVRDDKVVIFKKKRRKGYKVKKGHRQPYSSIKIDAISFKKK